MENEFTFELPDELMAKEPPERRGIARDQVRLMVIDRKGKKVMHSRFDHISEFLRAGDLLVFNSSRTLPASLQGCGDTIGQCIEVRLAEHLPDDSWLALLICRRGDPFMCGLNEGMTIDFSKELTGVVTERDERIPRLWKIKFSKKGTDLIDQIYKLGQPIRYEYVSAPWNLDYYQTVYAREPGSAEMPSAGRAFTWKILFELKKLGVEVAYLTLHTGLSSYMDDQLDREHPMAEEEFFIGENSADLINLVRESGGRIIAVGTTVVRALESATGVDGLVTSGHNYTRLKIDSNHKLKSVDGLLTGLHEPEASHLDLLNAFLPVESIDNAYKEAVGMKYLWHEFGDLNLIL